MMSWLLLQPSPGSAASVRGEHAIPSYYYISPEGNDADTGQTLTHAWRTLARVNEATLKPGDFSWELVALQEAGRCAGAVGTLLISGRLINPKSHSRMYHLSAIRAHAWPPRLQKSRRQMQVPVQPTAQHSDSHVNMRRCCWIHSVCSSQFGFGFTCI